MATTVGEPVALDENAGGDSRRFGSLAGLRTVLREPIFRICLLLIVIATWHIALLRPDVAWPFDDTAQYLSHARNLVTGRPYGETGYLYSPRMSSIGPQNYPPGLPIALAPLYKAYGLRTFKPYKIAGVLLTVLELLVVAVWCRRGPAAVSAAAVVAILGFNPLLTTYAAAIVSDPLFVLFTVAALYWLDCEPDEPPAWSSLIGGLLLAAACLTRTVGVALLGAVVLRSIARRGADWRSAGLTLLPPVLLSLAAARLLAGSAGGDYLDTMANYDWMTPLRNARLFAGDFAVEFLAPVPAVAVAKLVLAGFLPLLALGFVRSWRAHRGLTIWEYFAVVYGTLVVAWPSYQGARLLLPLLPWVTKLGLLGIVTIRERLSSPTVRRMAAAFVFLIIVRLYLPSAVAEVVLSHRPFANGVWTPEVLEMLAFVSNGTPAGAVMAATRPRAIAFYGGRPAVAASDDPSESSRLQFLNTSGADYLIVDAVEPRDTKLLAPLVDHRSGLFRLAFSNKRFSVWAVRGRTE